MFIWINGAYVSDETPVISGYDRGFLYGDGLFETLRVYPVRNQCRMEKPEGMSHGIQKRTPLGLSHSGKAPTGEHRVSNGVYPDTKSGFTSGRVFHLNEHLERLSDSARKLKIPLPVSRRSFNQAISRLLKLNNLSEARVRIALSRGKRMNSHVKPKCLYTKPTIIIETEPCPDYTKEREEGVKCVIAPYRRSVESPLFQHKTLNFLENILARTEAQHQKAFEALFVNSRNELAEGAMTNVFIVKRGRVFTPPLSANILPGITRKIVFGLCTGEGILVREKSLRRKDLSSADEVFLTGSIIEIMPVVGCNGKKIGSGKPGRITQLLQKSYQTLING